MLSESTLVGYREGVLAFSSWCLEEGVEPEGSDDFDDLLVEWKNTVLPKKSQFEKAVAGVELFLTPARIHSAAGGARAGPIHWPR